jgi:XTP/dITP diphosphohydrolase
VDDRDEGTGSGTVKLLLATKNRGKAREMEAILGADVRERVEILSLPDLPNVPEPREEGKTFAENARIKAQAYAGAHKVLCIADDSGLAVEALGGRPGVRSARYAGEGATDEKNIVHLLEELTGHPRPWEAAFVCAAAAAIPGRILAEAEGRVEGEIVPEPRGTGGFGYDPVFLVKALGKTMAELSTEEKNRISHRGRAMRRLVAALRDMGALG